MDDDVLLDDGRVYADALRDLAARLREAFMAQYTGRERMFALSLASGRPEVTIRWATWYGAILTGGI